MANVQRSWQVVLASYGSPLGTGSSFTRRRISRKSPILPERSQQDTEAGEDSGSRKIPGTGNRTKAGKQVSSGAWGTLGLGDEVGAQNR